MLEKALEISLIITAIHVSMLDGMIFDWFRIWISNQLEKCRLEWFKKPLFDCLICMGGIWTVILNGFNIPTILIVIGINTIITSIITHIYDN